MKNFSHQQRNSQFLKKDPVSYASKWCTTDKFYDRYLKCKDVRLHYDETQTG